MNDERMHFLLVRKKAWIAQRVLMRQINLVMSLRRPSVEVISDLRFEMATDKGLLRTTADSGPASHP